MDKDVDIHILHAFDTRADADMKIQDLSLMGHDVELRPFSQLKDFVGPEQSSRDDIFTCIYKQGFAAIRFNTALTAPLYHITSMPEIPLKMSANDELMNPHIWSSYSFAMQADEVKDNTDEEYYLFLNNVYNFMLCVPVQMRPVPQGQTVSLEDFYAPHITLETNRQPRNNVAVFPDNNSLTVFRRNTKTSDIKELYSNNQQILITFENVLDTLADNAEFCLFFSTDNFYHLIEQIKIPKVGEFA